MKFGLYSLGGGNDTAVLEVLSLASRTGASVPKRGGGASWSTSAAVVVVVACVAAAFAVASAAAATSGDLGAVAAAASTLHAQLLRFVAAVITDCWRP